MLGRHKSNLKWGCREGLAEEAASEQRQEEGEGVTTGPAEQRPRDPQGMSTPTKGPEEGQCGWSKVSHGQRKNEGQQGNKGRGPRALVASMRI